ncbi:MAG: hypothetical protein J0G33_02645 [Afipia felis]|nr:hypothetical protein [Afipia felis]
MPSFELTGPDGAKYSVSAPDENSALSAFSSFSGQKSAPAPDKYQQAAQADIQAVKDAGGDEGAGYTRRLAHGYTFGADSTVLAAMQTPLEMVRRGVGPSEGYNYAKAREDAIMGDAKANTGVTGKAIEMLGGGASAAKLAQGGLTFGGWLAPNAGLGARSLASAGDAGVLGAFSGSMEGNGLNERLTNAAKGAGIGLAAGAAIPPLLALGKGAISPIVNNIRARANPEGYAQSQVARAISESGLTPRQIGMEVADANAGGTPFTIADAMGNSGQRMLSTVARAPGQGRTDVVNFLEGRQAGQGRRVTNALAEGFDSPQTAAQTEAALIRARDAAANAEYGAVRSDAMPVDITNVIRNIDNTLGPRTAFGTNIANDSAEGALASLRSRLTDGRSNLTEFNAVQRVRGDLSDAVEAARRAGQGNRARLLGGALREMDAALENASPGFRQANANFAQASRNIDAVGQGRNAAMRGRTEDTIPEFRNLPPEGQAAYRSGYVDPLISQAQGAAFGVNKARPLINDAFQAEAAAMAPGNPLMQQRIARENTMFETRNHALGGSRTADNLADEGAMGVDPQIVGHVISGNWTGALRSALHAGKNVLTGNTPEVREQVARILLQRGVNPNSLNNMIGRTIDRIQFVQNIARGLGRGGAGALAVNGHGQNKN